MPVDPVTYEVLRHRLWMINDEQADVAMQVSGSPVVYETKDLSSALLRADGDALLVSAHASRLALCLQQVTKSVIQRCGENPGICPGDAFVTNDPWAGAIHQNDMAMVAPIFFDGALVAWTGIVMHETDVGGATPGGLSVGSADVFAEGPLVPPVKIVENGRLRSDIEAWAVRNTRTPLLNSLDIRGRLAACKRTLQRITEICERYGPETLVEVEDQIIERTRAVIAARLAALPDGAWSDAAAIDHDGRSDRVYVIRLSVQKSGSRICFDFTGTDEQAAGGINCTAIGMESGVIGSLLPILCYDLPWSTGALRPLIEIVSTPGTINNATFPAGVSHATVAASRATAHVTLSAMAKMCAVSTSGLAAQIEANWTAGWQGMTIHGRRRDRSTFTGVTLDQPGGGGGRLGSDGIDTGGTPGSPTFGVANVETYEKIYPLLYIYRREAMDSGGPGYHRGGVGTELLVVPHKGDGELDVNVVAHGGRKPAANGLYGGYPGSVQVRVLLRGSSVMEDYRQGSFPVDPLQVKAESVEPLAAKQSLRLREGDALLFVRGGGGGVGDPLERPAEQVLADVRARLCSLEVARGIYGVVIDDGQLDVVSTDACRSGIREGRKAAEPDRRLDAAISTLAHRDGEITIAYSLSHVKSATIVSCQSCGTILAAGGADPKAGSVMREVPITAASVWNRFGDVDHVRLREYSCPACGRLGTVHACDLGEPEVADVSFR